MAHTIQMTVNASLKDGDLIFRILNFKEDIHRNLLRGEYGHVADPASMDRTLAPVTITIPRKRHFDLMSAFMTEAMRQHGVGDAIRIAIQHS